MDNDLTFRWARVEKVSDMPCPYHGPMMIVFKASGETQYMEAVYRDRKDFFSRTSSTTYDYYYLAPIESHGENRPGQARNQLELIVKDVDREILEWVHLKLLGRED